MLAVLASENEMPAGVLPSITAMADAAPHLQDRCIRHRQGDGHQWPHSRSSRIHRTTSSVLTLGSCVRSESISHTASLRRRRATHARNASLIARLRSPAGTRPKNFHVSSSIITLIRLLIATNLLRIPSAYMLTHSGYAITPSKAGLECWCRWRY